MRALRVDKLTYAALEATLGEHLADRSGDTVPVLRMASLPVDAIGARAETLAAALRTAGLTASVIDGHSTIGGGSAPGSALPTRLVAVTHPTLSPDRFEEALRALDPPVIARIEDDRVLFDLRTVAPADDERLGVLVGACDGALGLRSARGAASAAGSPASARRSRSRGHAFRRWMGWRFVS